MKRHKHHPRLARQSRPARTPGQGWQIGTAPERTPPEASVRIDLSSPIAVHGVMRNSLTMRRPTPRDFAWFDRQCGSDRERTLKMIAHLCDVPTDIIDNLYRSDPNGILDACDAMLSED